MPANIYDHTSIERVYSQEDFARDSVENDRPGVEVLKGVRVISAPNAQGDFELAPASKHVGEAGDSIFLAPYRSAQPNPEVAYQWFVSEIIEAAQRDGYVAEASPVPAIRAFVARASSAFLAQPQAHRDGLS